MYNLQNRPLAVIALQTCVLYLAAAHDLVAMRKSKALPQYLLRDFLSLDVHSNLTVIYHQAFSKV